MTFYWLDNALAMMADDETHDSPWVEPSNCSPPHLKQADIGEMPELPRYLTQSRSQHR
jgi:hypothetical protein